MKKRQIIVSIIPVLALLFIVSLSLTGCKTKAESDETTSTGTPVTRTNVYIAPVTQYLELNATTVFMKKELVRTTFQGFVTKSLKNLGDAVTEGDVLFQIKTKEADATGIISDSSTVKMFNGYVSVKAKSSGILIQLNHNAGDLVADGEQLAVIANPSSLEILLNVPFQNVSQVRLNSDCILVLPDLQKIPAQVTKRIPSMDAASQTQTFLLHSSALHSLPENLNVIVRIPVKTVPQALVVPKSAILCDETQENFWVMGLQNDTLAVKIPVTKGIENDSIVQVISSGISNGLSIVNSGGYGLPDSAKVFIRK